MRRYYEILQLQPDATLDQAKRAYKKLAREWHPDRFPAGEPLLQKKAHDMFLSVQEAYARLEKFFQERSRVRFADEQPGYPRADRYPEQNEEDWTEETPFSDAPLFATRAWANGDKYEGMLLNEMFHGRGIFTYSNGDVYIGEFRFGKMEGHGSFQYADGGKYVGEFMENRKHGRGKLTFPNGDRYMGQFAGDEFHGEGVLLTQGKVYAGQWHYGGLLREG
ncbi:MAG: DnaJ domain-containing protein [Nitrospinae bacterium]|nr:DnaJ domain-containing protein [Nitrospinota bacterium]